MKILVADDNEDARVLLKELLQTYGNNVELAEDGEQALALARQSPPDLIISDALMPNLDGFAFCRAVKSDDALRNIPFIFYSSTYTGENDVELGQALGASRYLVKPMGPQQLIETINDVYERARRGLENVPDSALADEPSLNHMHKEVLAEKLQKKIGELQAERDALYGSEEKYRRLVETIQGEYFFYSHGADGVFTYLSPSIEAITGYTEEEFLTHYSEYLTDNAVNLEVERYTQNSIRGIEQPAYELELHRRDGSVCRLEVKETPVYDARGMVVAVEGIAHDVTERVRNAERLEAALVQTIQTVAMTVEKRDPYTADHQRRVAELAVAIATKLGCDRDRIHGIRMGAQIHDIGNSYVPAEILSRPGPLTGPEFEIVKHHSEVGNEIIRGVDFQWPVAEMILQHHERLDGSGYPAGLCGDEIILEARILAVADTVEAMTSHRPYRPAFDIQAALEEIKTHRGQRYDEQVVDACVVLFEQDGYRLPD